MNPTLLTLIAAAIAAYAFKDKFGLGTGDGVTTAVGKSDAPTGPDYAKAVTTATGIAPSDGINPGVLPTGEIRTQAPATPTEAATVAAASWPRPPPKMWCAWAPTPARPWAPCSPACRSGAPAAKGRSQATKNRPEGGAPTKSPVGAVPPPRKGVRSPQAIAPRAGLLQKGISPLVGAAPPPR